MMYYIESRQTDPYRNLALEQFVFDDLSKENSYFMLWQNHNSIIVGKHQNTLEEINSAYVKEKNITVARRLSGGGAVYHDLGNLNFTFICDADNSEGIDFSVFCEPISKALRSLGVPVEISGRNDMTVDGKKFSGNAQYIKNGTTGPRVMHHGTILYDSDLSILSKALKAGDDKIESKGIKSIQSRVTNIRPYMNKDMSITDFWAVLKDHIGTAFNMMDFQLNEKHNAAADELREKVYAQWSWNYGHSPQHTMRKNRRIEGCGKIEILLDIAKGGMISNIVFYGDFFANRDPAELAKKLTGHHLEYEEIKKIINEIKISQYFHELKEDDFLSLLFK